MAEQPIAGVPVYEDSPRLESEAEQLYGWRLEQILAVIDTTSDAELAAAETLAGTELELHKLVGRLEKGLTARMAVDLLVE